MDAILMSRFPGQVAPVRYHVNWPDGTDPYYAFNPTQVNERRTYYDSTVNGVPMMFFEGQYLSQVWDGSFATYTDWYNWVRATLDSLYLIPSPVRINLQQVRDNDSVYVAIDVISEDTLGSAPNIFVCYETTWDRYPGKGKYRYVFRSMDPNSVGGTLLGLTLPGDSVHVEYTYYMDPALNKSRMMTTVWVESNNVGGGVLNSISEEVPAYTVGVPGGAAPVRIVLDQNAPNPFNPTTTIGYSLDKESLVRLSVYSQAGRLVTNLVNSHMPAGSYSVPWNGTDLSGNPVGSGVYYYRLDAEKSSLTNKMILIR